MAAEGGGSMTVSALQLDHEFWRFSLAVYGAPGVEPECLALQEALVIDVNLLLFCAWLGAARRIALTAGDVESIGRVVEPWHMQAVRPLRAVRQQLKTSLGDDLQAFRSRLKVLELEAEQLEQAMLFAHAQQAWPRILDGDPRQITPANVRLYLQTQRHVETSAGDALSTQSLVAAAIMSTG